MELISCIRNFPKHCKTAIQNIWRNGVMSVSSIFAVTITLLLIGVIGVLAINVEDMTLDIEHSLTIYVKMERDVSDEDAQKIQADIENIAGVKTVTFSTKDQELDKLIEAQSEDGKKLFETYRENNPLGSAYNVEVKNAEDLEKIAEQINELDNVNSTNYGGTSTSNLVKTLTNIRNAGGAFVAGLTVIALFMIANTIKMAITSRQTEIGIMRMVGASNWYIRIPFMLEGIFIGVLGAIIPIAVIYYGYQFVFEQSIGFFNSSLVSLREPFPFIYQCSVILAVLGGSVGLIGSFFSVRKFLKF
jgi:cell division transport system permease protein